MTQEERAEKIAKLTEKLNELKEGVIISPTPESLIFKLGRHYLSSNVNFEVDKFGANYTENNIRTNLFTSQKEANDFREMIVCLLKMQRLAEGYIETPLNWKDRDRPKYYLSWFPSADEFLILPTNNRCNFEVYFDSKATALKVLNCLTDEDRKVLKSFKNENK